MVKTLMSKTQNPKGRAVRMTENRIYVLSECCNTTIGVSPTRAYCNNCGAVLEEFCTYSSSFPLTTFRKKRDPDYWWPWGELWFGLKEFSFEVEMDK